MSEQAPEPEYEPKLKVTVDCWNCDHKIVSSMCNTINFLYTKQPYFSNTQLTCLDQNCGAINVLFHDLMPDEGKVRAVQYPTSIYEFCDDAQVHDVRAQMVGAKEVKPMELSKRAEEQIAHWGEFLQRLVIDETDFGIQGNEAGAQ